MPRTNEKNDGGAEVAVLEQAHVHDGVRVIPLPEEEGGERRNADDRHSAVISARGEPVGLLTLVEHELEAGDAGDQQRESDVIDPDAGALASP